MSVITDFYSAPTGPFRWKQRQSTASRRAVIAAPPHHGDGRVAARNELVGAAIVANDAVAYASGQINEIEQYVTLGTDIRARLMLALRASLLEDSVFPTVTTDGDDGLIAQWKAGPRYLMLEVSSDGGYSLMATGDDGNLRVNVADDGNCDLEQLKMLVRDFTLFVVRRNPAWREQYA